MGKIVVVEKKKKKGRPSLIELQKRSLKFKKSPNFQNPNSRSTRRNPNQAHDSDGDDVSDDDGDGDVMGKRRKEKKINKLVLNSGSDCDDSGSKCKKKRKRVDSIVPSGSDGRVDDEGEKHTSLTYKTSFQQESKLDDGPSMPLPDKKLLLFILERLKKKDTHGVFSEPVDPEELPDYHEVISDPMDFGTLRKKLDGGAYANLEQFEKDVFLICSNALQYNAPDTIYFRQARAIQELAKKDFENLRKEDGDDNEPESEPEAEPKVVRRGRPPTKNLKRPPGRPPLERASSNISEAATTGGNTNRSSVGDASRSYNGNINRSNNDRKTPPVLDKQGSTDLFKRSTYGLHLGEDKSEDMIGSALKGTSMKLRKKNIVFDESRRNTYKQMSAPACRQQTLVLPTFDGERKLLFPIGIQIEHGYARSLSRFAAKLGPVALKLASAKISRCLPSGVEFGPGWVGDSEAPAKHPTQQQSPAATKKLSTPVSTSSQVILDSRTDESAKKPKDEQLLEGPMPSSVDGANMTPISSKSDAQISGANFRPLTPFNMLSSNRGAMKSALTNSIAHNQSRINGVNGSCGLNLTARMSKIIGSTRTSGSDDQRGHNLGLPSGDSHHTNKETNSLPNVVLCQKVGSGAADVNGSGMSGRCDSVQPDLALQL